MSSLRTGETPLWLAFVDGRTVIPRGNSDPSFSALLARAEASTIFSSWLCVCTVRPPGSLGEQPDLGAWSPRWVSITRDALWIWQPRVFASAARTGPTTPLDAGLPTSADDALAARLTLQLQDRLPLLAGVGLCSEGLQTGAHGPYNGADDPGGTADSHGGSLQGTDFFVWSPTGSWVLRAGTEGMASAWLMHLHAAVIAARLSAGPRSALACPLLLGDADVVAVAEAVISNAARVATARFTARVISIAGETPRSLPHIERLLEARAVRRQLRLFVADSPPNVNLLNAYEHVSVIRLLRRRGGVGVDDTSLAAHCSHVFRRFFSANAVAIIALPPLVSAALASSSASADFPSMIDAIMPDLLSSIRDRILLPFACARATGFTDLASERLRRAIGGVAKPKNLRARFFSTRTLSRGESFGGGDTSQLYRSDSVSRSESFSRSSISEEIIAGSGAGAQGPADASSSFMRRLSSRFFSNQRLSQASPDRPSRFFRDGLPEDGDATNLSLAVEEIQDDSFFVNDEPESPRGSPSSPLFSRRVNLWGIPSSSNFTAFDPLLDEVPGALNTLRDNDSELLCALVPVLATLGEEGRLQWAAVHDSVLRRVESLRLPAAPSCDAAEFALCLKSAGLTRARTLAVIPGDTAYSKDLWAESACDALPQWVSVRSAVVDAVLLAEEMRASSHDMNPAAVPSVPAGTASASTTTANAQSLSDSAFRRLFGAAALKERRATVESVAAATLSPPSAWTMEHEQFRLSLAHPVLGLLTEQEGAVPSSGTGTFEGLLAMPPSILASTAPERPVSAPLPRAALRVKTPAVTLAAGLTAPRYPAPYLSKTLCWVFWTPALPGGLGAEGVDLSGITRLGVEPFVSSRISLSLLTDASVTSTATVIETNFTTGLARLQRMLAAEPGSWQLFDVTIHVDGAVSFEAPPPRGTPRVAREEHSARGPWDALDPMKDAAPPVARGVLHASAALNVGWTRGVWAPPQAIDLTIAYPGAAPGVLSLLAAPASDQGAALSSQALLVALTEAATRSTVTSTHAVAVPASVTLRSRERVQVVSSLVSGGGNSVHSSAGAPIIAGILSKRGAFRSAYREREMRLTVPLRGEAARSGAAAALAPLFSLFGTGSFMNTSTSRPSSGPPSRARVLAERLALPRTSVSGGRLSQRQTGDVGYHAAGATLPLVVARAAGEGLLLSYFRNDVCRGKVSIFGPAGPRVLAVNLTAWPAASTPLLAATRSWWFSSAVADRFEFSFKTLDRQWFFSTASPRAAALWITALAGCGGVSRGALLVAALPPLPSVTRSKAVFATTSGLPDSTADVSFSENDTFANADVAIGIKAWK